MIKCEDLPLEKRAEFDALINECMKEIEENVPEPRATFDSYPDSVRRKITEKYLPRLMRIRQEADEQEDNN